MAYGTIVVAAAVLFLLLPCLMSVQSQGITDQVKQEISDKSNEWLTLYGNQDFVGLCNELYTEDCVIYMPGATSARGREECARVWETINEDDYQFAGFYPQMIKEVIVTSSGYVIEHSFAKDSAEENVKYLQVWKRIEGKLYIYHDITNVDTPYKEPTLLEDITDRRNEWSYYYNTGDFESACNVFSPDVWIAPPGAPPVSARDGCEKDLVMTAISGVARIVWIPEQYEVYDLGDGYILNHGAWIRYDEAGGEIDRGKDMEIWKRLEDGRYYVQFDMWNSDIHF